MTTAKDFCRNPVHAVRKTDTVIEVARRMREHHVGDVVVVDEREGRRVPVGILTDRDLVVSVLAGAPDRIASLEVGDVLTQPVVTVRADEVIEDVARRMRAHGIRRVPVVDAAGTLVGIVSFDDVLASIASQLSDLARLVARERQREEEQRS